MFDFKFSPNANMLHTAMVSVTQTYFVSELKQWPAQGNFLDNSNGYSGAAYHSTIVAANHFQLTAFTTPNGNTEVFSLSAKKGVPSSQQETWLQRWGPSLGILVMFIGAAAHTYL